MGTRINGTKFKLFTKMGHPTVDLMFFRPATTFLTSCGEISLMEKIHYLSIKICLPNTQNNITNLPTIGSNLTIRH